MKKQWILAFPKNSKNPWIFEIKFNYKKKLLKKLRGIKTINFKGWWDL